ncbi:oxalurate catabolism protein HpxZ [Aquabacterium sp. A7-Y]|uniref:oxalurate catabolism protein HpxZ n=1 Tax=Aquabacterium sp. A7-Y TaxID=1349605 RepID=UPI00223DB816|nr:oxalurate catabolism protein HpxZ [Aquabacterium sp. A7-Y]MCW7541202.1 oxalurate catabolism protein HpxZ [Aquabacterium sp. A7-Y]
MTHDTEVNLPEVQRELRALFEVYEAALMRNDVAALGEFFWDHEAATRYGFADVQHGAQAIAAYRATVPVPDFTRTLHALRISSFGRDFAVVQTQFRRSDTPRLGLQSQTWVRFAGVGWKIVAAHVSLVDL